MRIHMPDPIGSYRLEWTHSRVAGHEADRARPAPSTSQRETIMIGTQHCPGVDQILQVALPLAAPLVALAILLAINLFT